jgi:hypothetical protein
MMTSAGAQNEKCGRLDRSSQIEHPRVCTLCRPKIFKESKEIELIM